MKFRKRKGISLIVLIITIVVSIILISVALTSLQNNRADKQAREVKFKSEYDMLKNELSSYITDLKVKDSTASISINASDDELNIILPSLKKTSFDKNTFIICNSNLVFKRDSDLSEDELKWAEQIAQVMSSCEEEKEVENAFGITFSPNGATLDIPINQEKTTISTNVTVSDTSRKIKYAITSSNTLEPDEGEFLNITSGSSITKTMIGGTYYIWIKVYDNKGEYLGNYVSKPFILQYKVEYNAQGGSNAPATQYKNRLANIVIDSKVPTKSDYKFVGWSLYSSSDIVDYMPGDIYSLDKSVILYAIWQSDSNSSSSNKEISYNVEHYIMDTSGNYPDKATYEEKRTGKLNNNIYIDSLKQSNYEIDNGITYSYGTVNGTTTKSIKLTNNAPTIKLYYKRNYGTLTIEKGYYIKSISPEQNKVRYYYGDTIPTITVTPTSEEGYTTAFYNWTSNSNYFNPNSEPIENMKWAAMPEGTEVVLTANAIRKIHNSTLIIDPNGGSLDVTSSVDDIASTINSIKSYTQNYDTYISYKNPTKDSTYNYSTAVVTFNYNGNGQSDTTKTSNLTTSTVYTFNNWKKSDNFLGDLSLINNSGKYIFSTSNGGTSKITASWSPSTGSTTSTSITLPTPNSRTGYSFEGWYTGSTDGVKVGDAGSSYYPKSDITLYGHWDLNTFTLTRTGTTGGTVAGSYGSISSGTSCTVTATPYYDYKFMGWYEGGSKVSSSSSYTFDMPERSVNLVAKFMKKSIDIVDKETIINQADFDRSYTLHSEEGRIEFNGMNMILKCPGEGYIINFSGSEGAVMVSTGEIYDGYSQKLGGKNGTYITTSSDKYIMVGGNAGAGCEINIKLSDGTPCIINDIFVDIRAYMADLSSSYSSVCPYERSASGAYFTITGGVETILYVSNSGFTFSSSNSGCSVSYSSTISGSYSSVGSVSSYSSYTSTSAGYYKFYGSNMRINISGPYSSWVDLKVNLPTVKYQNISGSAIKYSGNQVTFGNGGLFYFKPNTLVQVTLKTPAQNVGYLSRSSTLNGTYSQLYTFPKGATTTYTTSLLPNYYYSISSAGATAYIRDIYGSAAEIVQ